MMCGNDKKAGSCLHPGLEVSYYPGRGYSFWLLGVGPPELHYIIYKINVSTSPDFSDDPPDTNGVGECDSRWLYM